MLDRRPAWKQMPMAFIAPVGLWISAGAVDAQTTTPGSDAQPYRPCIEGPHAMREIDAAEREGKTANIRILGRPVTVESAAEMWIADCSEHLGKIAGVARLEGAPAVFDAIFTTWRTNLDFMKWWLQNRRQKSAR